MPNTCTTSENLTEKLPTAKAIRTRLSAILREAAVLRRLLRIVEQAEKYEPGVDRE